MIGEVGPHHITTTHAPPPMHHLPMHHVMHHAIHMPSTTHAQPSLPVDQNPNPTPPNQGAFELHDTAANY